MNDRKLIKKIAKKEHDERERQRREDATSTRKCN